MVGYQALSTLSSKEKIKKEIFNMITYHLDNRTYKVAIIARKGKRYVIICPVNTEGRG
jgi:hypothetical protein